MISNTICSYISLLACICFILALRGLSSAKTAINGNRFGIAGIVLAFFSLQIYINLDIIIAKILIVAIAGGVIGYVVAKKINMTSLPQLLAGFHSLVGLAAVFISITSFFCGTNNDTFRSLEIVAGAVIGAVTFIGSIIAFGKLQGIISGKPLRFRLQKQLNIILGICLIALIIAFVTKQTPALLTKAIILAIIIGYMLIMPIGGADMPVVISMLNSYSGWATVGIGLSANNILLIIVGAIVGVSGAILSHIMCKGMNRTLLHVLFGNYGAVTAKSTTKNITQPIKICVPEDASFIIKNASSIIIVPGYGMAVAQAQHVIKELSDKLKTFGATVKFAIHPVAGRMPGHMNVLLAEANISNDDVFELDDINHEFGSTDVVLVIGANDITNPAAKDDPASPIFGMPILDVSKAKTVLFIKRTLGSGYAGIDNALFYKENTMMILGDAKNVCQELIGNF